MLYLSSLLLRLTHWKPLFACIILRSVALCDCVCVLWGELSDIGGGAGGVFDCSAAAEAETRRSSASFSISRTSGGAGESSSSEHLCRLIITDDTLMHRCVLTFQMSCLLNPLRHDWLLDEYHSHNHCIYVQPHATSALSEWTHKVHMSIWKQFCISNNNNLIAFQKNINDVFIEHLEKKRLI